MKRFNQKGFTLVELLVVIAIIVVLAGVVVVVINPANLLAKGRDAKRIQDVENLSKAISLALADGEITLVDNAGTDSATGTQALDGTNGYVTFAIPTGKQGLVKYIAALPVDPLNTAPSVYTYGAAAATGYELNAVLESLDNAAKMTTDGGNSDTIYEVGTDLTVL